MTARERKEELAHGGLYARDGDMVTLGDGSRWWLNGTQWARDEADVLITQDRQRFPRSDPMGPQMAAARAMMLHSVNR